MADDIFHDKDTNTVTTVYLFQTDAKKENRHFFEGMHKASPEAIYFRGLDFGTGRWKPDGVRIDLEIDAAPLRCSLVLIELEATESKALESARKYVPESSTDICNAFTKYLDCILKDCDSRADPREAQFVLLMEALKQNVPVQVKTAAALRSSTTFLEVTTFSDKARLSRFDETTHNHIINEGIIERRPFLFRNICKYSAEESKALRRCILILDAIIRQEDHSVASVSNWLMKAPLKILLRRKKEKVPLTLERFVLKQGASGITIDIEVLLSELVAIWAENDKQIDTERARKLIIDYFPIALAIKPQEKMDLIFKAANPIDAR